MSFDRWFAKSQAKPRMHEAERLEAMKFGLFDLPTYMPDLRSAQQHYRGVIEQVEFADQVGIDYAWIVEHHFVRHGGLFPAN